MNEVYAKTLLGSLCELEEMTTKIDGLVYARAMNAHHFRAGQSTLSQMEEIVKLMNKKNDLINLKVIADEAFRQMECEPAQMLRARFVEGASHDVLIRRYGYAERTYFRKFEKAVASFVLTLERTGFDDAWFRKHYFSQRWLKERYEKLQRFAEGKSDRDRISAKRIRPTETTNA